MTSIVALCCAWNAERYEQEYNYALASKLLMEETMELFEATTQTDKLDAIGDIVFVAIGVFWKAGFSVQDIEDIFDVEEKKLATYNMQNVPQMCEVIQGWCVGEYKGSNAELELVIPGLALATYSSFIVALGALAGMGMQHRFYDVVEAICDSNNTKEVKGKTASHVKANVVKGEGFVPPTVALMNIIAEEQVRARNTANA